MKKNILGIAIAGIVILTGCNDKETKTVSKEKPKEEVVVKISSDSDDTMVGDFKFVKKMCEQNKIARMCTGLTSHYAKKEDKENTIKYLKMACSSGEEVDCKEASRLSNLSEEEIRKALN